MKHLESLINFKLAVSRKEPKHIVKHKYLKYLNDYDNIENPTVADKIRHRETFFRYLNYMKEK